MKNNNVIIISEGEFVTPVSVQSQIIEDFSFRTKKENMTCIKMTNMSILINIKSESPDFGQGFPIHTQSQVLHQYQP